MTLHRKDLSDFAGDASYGVVHAGGSQGASLATEVLVSPGQMLYMRIPARDLRNFVDGLLPDLAKNPIADCARGMGHRYRAGHDLFLDVPSTLVTHGPTQALRQIGHILATDFPTKAGIPIPGLSQSGLGHVLEQWGIRKAWMSLNISDAGFGFLAVADGHATLLAALEGQLSMDFGTALHTFGAGALELTLASVIKTNPLLTTLAGIENILAGLVSTWKTHTVYVDPLDFFGAAGMSSLLGFGIAYGLVGESITDATRDAIRSGTIGALYSVSTAFGYGAIAGFAVCRLAAALAEHHDARAEGCLRVDPHSYRLLVEALCAENADVQNLLASTSARWIPDQVRPLSDNSPCLPSAAKHLSSAPRVLDDRATALSGEAYELQGRVVSLPADPVALSDVYRAALTRFTSRSRI